MRYLFIEEIISLHGKIIAQSGGSSGLLDRGALESAVAQPEKILDQLSHRGWCALPVEEHELEWWADQMWMLESLWSPVGTRAYVTFLVDPQSRKTNSKNEAEVWAVMASAVKPSHWQFADRSFTLRLAKGWEKGLSEFFEHLDKLRISKCKGRIPEGAFHGES